VEQDSFERTRLAQTEDFARILTISANHRSQLSSMRGGQMFLAKEAEPVEERLISKTDDTSSVVLVGLFDDVIFGYAIGETQVLKDNSKVGSITDFVVEKEARSVGIGESMMNSLVDFFTEMECIAVESRTFPGDRATKNFFESFGLKARLLTVSRDLSQD